MTNNYKLKFRIKLTILLQILMLALAESEICCGKNISEFFVRDKSIFLKENQQVLISLVQDVDIDSQNNIWLIDWKTSQLLKLDKDGKNPVIIATKGKGPGELIMPQSIFINKDDHVYIANFGNRISEFNPEGKHLRAFITTDGHFPTTCIALNSKGSIIIGGPKRERYGNSLTGTMIHIYNSKGVYFKSFCQIDKKLRPMNLERYRGVYLDVDEDDNIYTVQPMDYKVTVFDKNGHYVKRFGEKQNYYREPKHLPKEVEHNKEKMLDFKRTITYVMDIFTFDGKVAILSRNLDNDKYKFKYYIDLYEYKSGKLITGGIESQMLLFRIKKDKFYFLKNIETNQEERNILEIYRRRK